jgi:hypothetical protein
MLRSSALKNLACFILAYSKCCGFFLIAFFGQPVWGNYSKKLAQSVSIREQITHNCPLTEELKDGCRSNRFGPGGLRPIFDVYRNSFETVISLKRKCNEN